MQTDVEMQTLRERAVLRLRKKREFVGHVVAYLIVNAVVIAIWAMVADGGFFWPVFPLLGWGIGVFFHGWDVYYGGPSEEAIRREMERMG